MGLYCQCIVVQFGLVIEVVKELYVVLWCVGVGMVQIQFFGIVELVGGCIGGQCQVEFGYQYWGFYGDFFGELLLLCVWVGNVGVMVCVLFSCWLVVIGWIMVDVNFGWCLFCRSS